MKFRVIGRCRRLALYYIDVGLVSRVFFYLPLTRSGIASPVILPEVLAFTRLGRHRLPVGFAYPSRASLLPEAFCLPHSDAAAAYRFALTRLGLRSCQMHLRSRSDAAASRFALTRLGLRSCQMHLRSRSDAAPVGLPLRVSGLPPACRWKLLPLRVPGICSCVFYGAFIRPGYRLPEVFALARLGLLLLRLLWRFFTCGHRVVPFGDVPLLTLPAACLVSFIPTYGHLGERLFARVIIYMLLGWIVVGVYQNV